MYKEVINYIIDYMQSYTGMYLDKIKLAKILWFADRAYMYRYDSSLTGFEYLKLQNGPAPKKYDSILTAMKNDGIIEIFQVSNLDKEKECFLSLKKPNLDKFTSKQIQIIDLVIMQYANKTSKELSELSHDELYDSVNMGDTMPIESVFWQDIQIPSQDDITQARDYLNSKHYDLNSCQDKNLKG